MLVATGTSTRNRTETIYISLVDEGVDVLRPAQGICRGEYEYEVMITEDYDPEDEVWQFVPGDLVRCEFEWHEGEKLLVAKALAEGGEHPSTSLL